MAIRKLKPIEDRDPYAAAVLAAFDELDNKETETNQKQRAALINQLDKSFLAMPNWVKATVKHAMGAPEINPETGKKFTSFREVIEVASDECLETLRNEFEENNDLLPADS